ncbi:MAG: hypothetical protein CEE38_22900 [Planctomycetes bacterium B3_Pla]|nr:MAG: hypothetical protein CEE38_22900 [Planctomycetes bacterium B3_Pla]
MNRRVRTLLGISFLALYVLANLPLIRIIWIHDGATIISIIGHSPDQFLFLALFFPVVLLQTYKLTNLTLGIGSQDRYQSIRNATFLQRLTGRRVIIASSLVICLSIATVDIKWTTPDFYHKKQRDASEAAELNRAIITSLSKAETKGEKDEIEENLTEKVDRLRHIYEDPDNLDPIIRTFEFLELSACGFAISLLLWMLYLNLELLDLSRRVSDPELSKDLKGEIKKAVPCGVVAVIVYLFWPPFRLYNIFEIQQVIDYQTLNPLYVYGLIAVAAITLIMLQYSRFGPKFISTLTAVLTFLASGALMGVAHLTPESLVHLVGSGMGFGNLFFLTFVIAVIYVFGLRLFTLIARK